MGDDQTRLIRRGLWIFVGIGLATIVSDLVSGREAVWAIGAYRAAGLLGVVAGIAVLHRRPTLAVARTVVTAVFAVTVAAFLAQTAVSRDPFGTPLLLAMVCLTVAVFVPWRWRDQLRFVAIALAGVVGNWLIAGGPLFLMFHTALACVASVPVALFLERERAALEALRAQASASEARLRQIADHAREVFWMLDFGGRDLPEVSYVSPAARTLIGLEPGMSGRDALLERIHPEDRQRLLSLFGMAERVRQPGAVDFRVVTPDGQLRHVQARFTPIRDDAGRLVRLGGVLEDVTAERLAAAAVERARDEAETTARVRNQFLAAMSHEISTPLTAILGTLDLLRDAGATTEQRRRWDTVRAGAQSLHLLLSDALDFTKSEAGTLRLRAVPLDLGELIFGIVELHAAPARSRGLDLRFEWQGPLLFEAVGDGDRVRQILNNLVSNAIKFTPTGEVCVRVAPAGDGSGTVRFAVSDTGIGVNAEVRRRIFDPFTQGDDVIARRYGGSGMGLAIARRLVRIMGGAIGVDSLPRGSTFWFSVPLGGVSTEAAEAPSLAGRRLRVVAADAVQREALVAALVEHGAVAESWPSWVPPDGACEAVLLVADVDPSAGRPPLAALLAGCRAEPPVVVLTAGGRGSDAAAAVDAGAATWLAAPLRAAGLAARLAAVTSDDARRGERRPRAAHGRILVVDDSEIVRRVTVDLLRSLGHEAEAAAGGDAALAALRQAPIDLVLLDCQMPEMDGFEVARRIRASEVGSAARVVIVAFSAGAPEIYRGECLAAGMDDCLAKPIDGAALDTVLTTWLGAASAAEAGASTPLDRARLAELAGSSPATVRRYGDLFVREAREVIRAVGAAAAGEGVGALPAVAHRARGAAAYIGAMRFEQSLARLDGTPLPAAELDALAAELSQALAGFERSLHALERDLS